MNVFSNAYFIKSCFWGAGTTYKWPKKIGQVGIGIVVNVIKRMPEKFMIKAYKNYYEIDKKILREYWKNHKQDIFNAKGTKLLIIPRSILFDWGREV